MEFWKDVPGYEGAYQVSNFGRVRSLDRLVWNGRVMHMKKGRIKKQTLAKNGYKVVNFGQSNLQLVHRLVCSAFYGGVYECVNHKDGNKQNNRLCNLEPTSYLANNIHALETGLRKRKVNLEIASAIKDDMASGIGITKVAKKHGVDSKTVYNVINNSLSILKS